MMASFILLNGIEFLVLFLVGLSIYFLYTRSKQQQSKGGCKGAVLPGPAASFPFLGSIHLLRHYEKMPFEAFTLLSKVYGPVFGMKIGAMNCAIVSGVECSKEVLLTKADAFSHRPTFLRLVHLFGDEKQNSLAFCDASNGQEARRALIKTYAVPKSLSCHIDRLNQICQEEIQILFASTRLSTKDQVMFDLKDSINKATANIFIRYFCGSPGFHLQDPSFSIFITAYDAIFWEVNNGRISDFIPSLFPLTKIALKPLKRNAAYIRSFIENKILIHEPLNEDIFSHVYMKEDCNRELALFAIEDLIGGHSAVANTVLRIIFDILSSDNIKNELRKEIMSAGNCEDFKDIRREMPLLNACFYETIRLTASPVIPHRSRRDTTLGNYFIPDDTVIFINNHYLNYSPDLWENPEAYNPHRFLNPETGCLSLPSHFQPFSVGRRSCIGYKLTQMICTFFVAEVLKKIDLDIRDKREDVLPLGMLASRPGPVHFMAKWWSD